MKKEKALRNFVISVKILLYICVSIISTIHVIDFFELTNPYWLAVSLAIAFEIGAAASLAAILVLPKAKQTMVWIIFIVLTLTQAMGNMYFAYDNAQDYQTWMELFALTDFTIIEQKRILAIASGAILPLIALGFIKSLVDYLKPDENTTIITELQNSNEKSKEIDNQKQKEKEEQRQKELEEQRQKELEEKKQKELEEKKQKELEEKKQKELEEKKQKELEEQRQKELEEKKQKELEEQRQKELEEELDKIKKVFSISYKETKDSNESLSKDTKERKDTGDKKVNTEYKKHPQIFMSAV